MCRVTRVVVTARVFGRPRQLAARRLGSVVMGEARPEHRPSPRDPAEQYREPRLLVVQVDTVVDGRERPAAVEERSGCVRVLDAGEEGEGVAGGWDAPFTRPFAGTVLRSPRRGRAVAGPTAWPAGSRRRCSHRPRRPHPRRGWPPGAGGGSTAC